MTTGLRDDTRQSAGDLFLISYGQPPQVEGTYKGVRVTRTIVYDRQSPPTVESASFVYEGIKACQSNGIGASSTARRLGENLDAAESKLGDDGVVTFDALGLTRGSSPLVVSPPF